MSECDEINELINIVCNKYNIDQSELINLLANSKKKKRGRPKKEIINIEEETTYLIDVSIIYIHDTKYYKTQENILLNENKDIIGLYKNNSIEKYILK